MRSCLYLLVTFAQAAAGSGDSAVVAALERRIEQATMRGDVAYLDSVYAPSFRFKHSTGVIEERGPRLAALRARRDTVFARDRQTLDGASTRSVMRGSTFAGRGDGSCSPITPPERVLGR